ncbi:Potassium/sodium hyperpolarization-activated cyclic nucleotide-gated channel 4 [Holothuria leucospilota]|uniref:Potassium/sodium hyperpolarization-activated cyclic nucleotide-gated channel 4 n=1 Tax=Holothuria leucospilota TaxID=206669 RepID=A0A9Q0YMM1_HOLLE|nr:Potassium/sodium hyperpolarization-activated cyclic nucleotide-gated channel 4 [Holothuria leucospilota]
MDAKTVNFEKKTGERRSRLAEPIIGTNKVGPQEEDDSEESDVNIAIEYSHQKFPDCRRRKSLLSSFRKKETLFHASDKQFVKKIFRSAKALRDEQERQQKIHHFVIHPFSNFRWYWDLLMVLLMSITLLLVPLNIAFYSDQFVPWFAAVNCVFDAFFIFDIILNFFTGFMVSSQDEVVLDRMRIILHYSKGWFVIDLLSSFPLDYIYFFVHGENTFDATAKAFRVLRLAKVLSLLRLLRLTRLMRYVSRLEEILNVEGAVIRIVHLVLIVLLISHWNGCIQFLIPFYQGFPEDSWVMINGLKDASKWEQYSWSFFKSMCHMLSIGYGRFPPSNLTDLWTTTLSIMLGATFYALFIGNMSTLLLSVDASGRLYNEKINQVKEYMRYRRIPLKIQRRVLEYYDHRYQRKLFDEVTILSEQSHPLRRAILQYHLRSLLSKVDFFSKGDSEFVDDVLEKLHFEVYLKGDVIIKAGSRGDSMYFIEHGSVAIEVNGRVVNTLCDGDHFGEISLLSESERRVASVVAATTCDTYCLSREDFNHVLKDYPAMRQQMSEIAQKRLKSISGNESEDNTVAQEMKVQNSALSKSTGSVECIDL